MLIGVCGEAVTKIGTVGGLWKFDSTFFNVHPKLAEKMDPQIRIMLESTYEAFVDAGAFRRIIIIVTLSLRLHDTQLYNQYNIIRVCCRREPDVFEGIEYRGDRGNDEQRLRRLVVRGSRPDERLRIFGQHQDHVSQSCFLFVRPERYDVYNIMPLSYSATVINNKSRAVD